MPNSALTTSVAVYRALLRLYPTEHRREYGPHMLQVFGDCCRDASERGPVGFVDLWTTTLIDLVKSAFEERARKGFRMSREAFVRWCSLAAVLGGLAWTVGLMVLTSRPAGVPGSYRFAEDLVPVAFACLCSFTLASVGHALSNDATKTRGLALSGAGIAVIATLLLLLSSVLWILGVNFGDPSGDIGWRIQFALLVTLMLAFGMTGLSSLRNAASRLVGVALVAAVALNFLGNGEDDRAWFWLPFGLAWIAFGLTHLARSFRPRTPQAS